MEAEPSLAVCDVTMCVCLRRRLVAGDGASDGVAAAAAHQPTGVGFRRGRARRAAHVRRRRLRRRADPPGAPTRRPDVATLAHRLGQGAFRPQVEVSLAQVQLAFLVDHAPFLRPRPLLTSPSTHDTHTHTQPHLHSVDLICIVISLFMSGWIVLFVSFFFQCQGIFGFLLLSHHFFSPQFHSPTAAACCISVFRMILSFWFSYLMARSGLVVNDIISSSTNSEGTVFICFF